MKQFHKAMAAAVVTVLVAGTVAGQTSTSLHFDGQGIEAGITVLGATDFSVAGASFSGGMVQTAMMPPLHASGATSYMITAGPGQVAFDNPIDSVTFFFVHGGGFLSPGTAKAIGVDGTTVARVGSNAATSFGDPANYVTLDSATPIARIEITSGSIDDFTFVTQGDCAPGAMLCGDRHLVSVVTGGTQVLTLDAGPENAGRAYAVLASLAGTSPGVVLPYGMTLPLNPDPLLTTTMALNPRTPLVGQIGVLDESGRATASVVVPSALSGSLVGTDLHTAFVLRSFAVVSNAEFVTVGP